MTVAPRRAASYARCLETERRLRGTPTGGGSALGAVTLDQKVFPDDTGTAPAFFTFTLPAPTATLGAGTPIYVEFSVTGNAYDYGFYGSRGTSPGGYESYLTTTGTPYPTTSTLLYPAVIESMLGCF